MLNSMQSHRAKFGLLAKSMLSLTSTLSCVCVDSQSFPSVDPKQIDVNIRHGDFELWNCLHPPIG